MLLRTIGGLALLFLVIQLVRPELTHPPAKADFQAPADVTQILRNSCYACHSNETRLSWFDKIVPAYWLVARDVRKARMLLNFSELGAMSRERQDAVLFESVNQIQMGAMPLPSYVRLHPEAAVMPGQTSVLRDYLLTAELAKRSARVEMETMESQSRTSAAASGQQVAVKAAPNGIAFFSDYRNWKAISSTDRFDTNTVKMILGNDVAIKAIAENNINPWPNGTAFAKVSWRQQPDANGVVRTGTFLQVAFMIKNSRKYASTAGWGWAQWMGTELKPYGTSPSFSSECVACHAPLRNNDYVFTMPIGTRGGSR